MRRSEQRILTTHTGSLPRPAALTQLYLRRLRGESVDPAELERQGLAALRRVVDGAVILVAVATDAFIRQRARRPTVGAAER